MADFSKQYCDIYDPEMPHDFDIEKVAEKLDNDYYLSFICEGFGFSAIGKDPDGEIILYFNPETHEESNQVGWVKYKEFIDKHTNRKL